MSLRRSTSFEEVHYQNIQVAVKRFLIDYEVIPENLVDRNAIRAIMISGDALQSAYRSLLDCLPTASGEHTNKIRDSIDLKYMGAVGAGYRGLY